ncbi:ArsR/SmtB family transcription factor [candidate division KSB1 bacterium]
MKEAGADGIGQERSLEVLGSLGELRPKFFKALCDPNRVWILKRLINSPAPLTVSEIGDCCSVDLSVVSRHLGKLREAGILSAERRGKEVYYSVRGESLAATLRTLSDAILACPCCRTDDKEE